MSKSVTNSTTLVAWLRESSVVKEKKENTGSALTQHNGISIPPFTHTHTRTHKSFIQYSAFCMPTDIRVLCAFNKYYINQSFWHNLQFSWGVNGVTCFQKENGSSNIQNTIYILTN